MRSFRILLIVFFICVGFYTTLVIINHGWNLLPVFFHDMAQMTWSGQFNTDFMCFLILSGLWISWRYHFTLAGIAAGVLFFFGGIMVLAPYLFFMSIKVKGDMKLLLLGER